MVVAVVSVWMVQVPVHEIVDVISVRNRFVAAARPMDVVRIVSAAGMARRANVRVRFRDLDLVLLHLTVCASVMQVSVVEIVHMVAMLDSRVSATGAVLVIVVFVQMGHLDGLSIRVVGNAQEER